MKLTDDDLDQAAGGEGGISWEFICYDCGNPKSKCTCPWRDLFDNRF